jgi:chromate transporter
MQLLVARFGRGGEMISETTEETAVASATVTEQEWGGSPFEVLRVFARPGVTSFGGPVAHLGYFHAEFVERRRWLDEVPYADIVALYQFLPGPASSQTGISIGLLRAGLPGAFCAWLGFIAPLALAMILFGYGVTTFGNLADSAWLRWLKIVAVAVVAQAVWGIARNLCLDRERATIAVGTAMLALAIPSAPGQTGGVAAGGLIDWALLRDGPQPREQEPLAMIFGAAAATIVAGLPVMHG